MPYVNFIRINVLSKLIVIAYCTSTSFKKTTETEN
jgi:hypothetical protein